MLLKKMLPSFILLMLVACAKAPQLNIPKEYEKLKEASGDLNKDGQPEKVVVYNTSDSNNETGKRREIIIYTLHNKQWQIWQQSKYAIMGSEEGGMMGDPFEELKIEHGVLMIGHAGGSSWKWSKIDRYRFQNNRFQLIGCTVVFGKPCAYWQHTDYNLSTGKVYFTKTTETCNESGGHTEATKKAERFPLRLKKPVSLQNRYKVEIKIQVPKSGDDIYL